MHPAMAPLGHSQDRWPSMLPGTLRRKQNPARVFFFFVAPFCSCPASLVSRKFFAVGPGCAKCFFLLRSVGRRDLSAGQKKNTTQGVFFFAPAPGKGKGRRSPVGRRHGARAKKKHHPGCFFAAAPAKSKRRRSPVGRRHGARAKKKTPWVVFFFLLWPRAGAQRGFSFACFSPGPQQKKTPSVVFFFALAPCRRPTGLLLPLPFAGAAAKKKPPWVVFFLLLRPRADAHSLTAGLGGDASPSPGWCFFFFLLRPRPDRGGVFFLLWPRPDAHSLTVGWGDFGKARVVFFCLLRPRRVFLDNNKKCLGYYIGSKKTRRGHSKKKNTTSNKTL